MRRILVWVMLAMLAVVPAQGARIVSQLSRDTVDITSCFSGERMTFFGTVAPDVGSAELAVPGPFHVVVVVIGPTQNRVARQMTHNLGIWLNTDQVIFPDFPSYFHVLSSGRLREITNLTTLTAEKILPEAHTLQPNDAGWWKTAVFGRELVRLMTEEGLFGVDENAINFPTENFYSARLTLPSNAPPGPYLALTYVFQNGEVIARKSEGFAVRKIGFERFLAIASTQQPFVYGVVCVLLALFTGWMGGVIFRR